MRADANLRYLYTGEQKHRGRPKLYDGKVSFDNFSRWQFIKEVKPDILLYTEIFNSPRFKINIRVVCLVNKKNNHYTLLFSTDLELSALEVFTYYKARFQIEFLFRDAKQFTGLSQCQARKKEAINFHFNASLSVLNVIKKQDRETYQNTTNKGC